MGYSRYGHLGKGLSDRGYAKYVTKQVKTKGYCEVKNPASYLVGMARLGTPVGWSGKAGYKGSQLESVVKESAARGMVGSQTTSYSQAPAGVAHAVMGGGGAGGGDWQRPQPKVEAPSGGAGIGTIAVVGGIGYLLWSLLK